MPHTNKASAPVSIDIPEFEGRYVDLGGYTVGFETYKADADPAEFFRGLPDDRCQCPHWGVVLTGSISRPASDAHDAVLDHVASFYAGSAGLLLSPWPTPDLTGRGWQLVGHPMFVVRGPVGEPADAPPRPTWLGAGGTRQ